MDDNKMSVGCQDQIGQWREALKWMGHLPVCPRSESLTDFLANHPEPLQRTNGVVPVLTCHYPEAKKEIQFYASFLAVVYGTICNNTRGIASDIDAGDRIFFSWAQVDLTEDTLSAFSQPGAGAAIFAAIVMYPTWARSCFNAKRGIQVPGYETGNNILVVRRSNKEPVCIEFDLVPDRQVELLATPRVLVP